MNTYWGSDGVEDSLGKWAERNARDPTPAAAPASDGVMKISYTGCADNADVILYRVEDGGHAWPGSNARSQSVKTRGDINATELLWGFFVDHPCPDSVWRGRTSPGRPERAARGA
ncbi:MAG: hypothetical protein GY859_32855 [Desulfobacterales bacterium]|nr:hypothetical protein [Desulfobacterales bacterium]